MLTPEVDFPPLVSPTDRSGKRTFYRPELDVLRFSAFFAVFVHHLPLQGLFPGAILLQMAGMYGMGVFFILSAYLITELLLREADRSGTVRIKAFFMRRVLRIWPLYFLILAVGYYLGRLVTYWYFPSKGVLSFSLLAGNFYVAANGWSKGGVDVLWSLSIEEQFYLIIPALAKFGGRKALRLAGCAFILSAFLAVCTIIRRGNPSDGIVLWTNSLVNFQFFAAGILLAVGLRGQSWAVTRNQRLLLLGAAVVGFVYAAHTLNVNVKSNSELHTVLLRYLVLLASTVIFFLAFLGAKLGGWKPFIYLGQISYGLYVFHDFIIKAIFYPMNGTSHWHFAIQHPLLADCLALALSIGIAAVSFRFFEKPINKFKQRFAAVPSGAPG